MMTQNILLLFFFFKKLGQKLQRLDEEYSQLSLPRDRDSTARVARTRNPEEGEFSPPPDYQASIITPPAYIVAPRKVPSYRSLENLFAFARTRSQRPAQVAAAVAAANSNDVVQDASTVSQPHSGEVVIPVMRATEDLLPEMREVGPGFSECTLQVLDTISLVGDLDTKQRSGESIEDVEGLAVATARGKGVNHEQGSDVTVLDTSAAMASGSSSSPASSDSTMASRSLQKDSKGKAPSRE